MPNHNPRGRQILESPSELFHEASKLRESDVSLGRAVWSINTSAAIKRIISCPAASFVGFPSVSLLVDSNVLDTPLSEAFLGRRSVRAFSGDPMSRRQLSLLLYYGSGVTASSVDQHGVTWGLRCAPSGGALYPIDIYCAIQNADGFDPGVYSYDPIMHTVQILRPGLLTSELASATFLEGTIARATALIFLVANFPRTKFKYGERGYRFALIEAGHIAQNLLLAAHALGLGSVTLGGFVDDRVNALLDVDGCDRAAVYGVLVGNPENVKPGP